MTLQWRPFRRVRTWIRHDYCMAGSDESGHLGLATQRLTFAIGGAFLSQSDPHYWYDWGMGPLDAPTNYARMFWGLGDGMWAPFSTLLAQAVQRAQQDYRNRYSRDWLIGNECAEPYDQCGYYKIDGVQIGTVPAGAQAAARRYHEVYAAIKNADPNARIFGCGCMQIGLDHVKNWWDAFLTELDQPGNGGRAQANNQHIHLYPCLSKGQAVHADWPAVGKWRVSGATDAADAWYTANHVGKGLTGEIWITETGTFAYNEQLKAYDPAFAWELARANVMVDLKKWFAAQNHYARMYWYRAESRSDDEFGGAHWPNALVCNGQLTPLGTEWLK